MSDHAKLTGPSSAFKHFNCAASAMRELQVQIRNAFLREFSTEVYGVELPPEDKDAADLGTARHTLVEKAIKQGEEIRVSDDPEGDSYAVEQLNRIVHDMLGQFAEASRVYIEEKVQIKGMASFGTPDYWYLIDDTLHVDDLKTGRVEVEAQDNFQLMLYAVGILDSLGWRSCKTVSLAIKAINFKESEWSFPVEELRKWRDEFMIPAYRDAHTIGAPGTVGPWCKNCDAKVFCPEYVKDTKAKASSIMFHDDFTERDTEELEQEWVDVQQVVKFEAVLKDELKMRFQTGMSDPKVLKLQKGRRLTKYKLSEDEILEIIPRETAMVEKLRTPTQLKKMIGDDEDLAEQVFKIEVSAPVLKIK